MKTLTAVMGAITPGTFAALVVLSMLNLNRAESVGVILVNLTCVVVLTCCTVSATVRRARENRRRDELIARLAAREAPARTGE